MSIMGIDMGTTGCKAGVFSAGGDCIAHTYLNIIFYTNRRHGLNLTAKK